MCRDTNVIANNQNISYEKERDRDSDVLGKEKGALERKNVSNLNAIKNIDYFGTEGLHKVLVARQQKSPLQKIR